MASTVIWLLIAAGIFAFNHFQPAEKFIGIFGTEKLLGRPLDGGFLALAVALYCLVRYAVSKKRGRRGGEP